MNGAQDRGVLPFERCEYEERWHRVRAECKRRGLDGVVVVSRGGAQTDSYADVLYLSNHYNAFPLLADRPPSWSGHSHSAVVLGLEGEPTLVDGFGEYRRDLVAVEDTRVSADLPAGIVEVLDEKGLAGGEVGLVAGNSMLLAPARRLEALARGTRLVVSDDLVENVRVRKSAGELERMRTAAAAAESVMTAILRTVVRGDCTEADAVAAGYAIAVRQGVAMYDAAVSSGPHVDRYTFGRLPSWSTRELAPGEIFHIDLYGCLDGYMFDFSRTAVAGRPPDSSQLEMLEQTAAAIDTGVQALAPGLAGSEVFAMVRGELADRGLAEPWAPHHAGDQTEGFGGYACHGHGLGLWWEWPWITPWEERMLEPGMVIAIECMSGREGVGAAKLEQNAILDANGGEPLLTLPAICTAETL